ncbi:sugar phosphate isomerase/epimerase and 4-hydroxyphenylpyruvate domain-containing protein [Sinomonas susongensis]|uniref:sugar phosphate isomerase/epimerase and 4-hydroxyphenylpyruvate domain-containing protein n=1 Tax=Sinomonas susongensis TaxID=1324851 RepID=UPI0011085ACE|nr:sugar phosphate isomerase/epimerase and 4-hydroxyphenylpyruvate domain-containing protein [Sinomonas susongensis]
MRTGIATVCLSGTLEQKLRAAARAGFGGAEIFEADLVASSLSPEAVRALAEDLGLGLDLYQPFRDFDSVSDELFRANLRRAEAKFKLMGRLGIDTILVCSTVAAAGAEYRDDDGLRAEQLHSLAELAADHGVKVAYEALAWGTFVNDFEHAWRLVADADHPNLGACLDTFHILSRGWNTEPIEGIPGEKIFFVQVADAPKLSMDVLSWSRHYRVFPGEGQFDLPKFLGHVARTGYNGPVSLEVFNDTFRQSDVERTAVDAMRSLIWLEERTAKHLAAEAAGASAQADGAAPTPAQLAAASRAHPMPLTTLPQVAPPTGINFAEVKSADAAASTVELERLLVQLGFEPQGEHRTKPVSLWTLGDARIIVNRQQASGVAPAISALGFDVENSVSAVARALQLKAVAVPRTSQANEEVLQAVQAPDSTEVFLCQDTLWVGEFGAASAQEDDGAITPPAASTAPATSSARIDHINLAQPWQHYDEGVLFYSSVLALTPQPSQEVSSPTGLVRSQVMQTELAQGGRAVRLALNLAPWVQADTVRGTVEDTFQEHIAISVPDLVATARGCRARNLPFLEIPENYYEDLDARFALEPEFLATLRELDLMYDRDENGAFLHFYTATVGSVFFEMVQRIDGYDGFGAPNAPIRHAVQHSMQPAGRLRA